MTTSVVIYSNPAQAMFWETIMNSPYVFPIGAGIVTFLVSLLVFMNFTEKASKKYRGKLSYLSLFLAAICGIAQTWYLC